MPNKTAAEFIVEMANAHPGEITVVALASATNVSLALRRDPSLRTKLREVVHLGGAFFVNGNVNPAAEANIFCDPEAADEMYGSGVNVTVVGLDVTQKLMMMKADLESMRSVDHPETNFLYDISQFYMAFHKSTVGVEGIFMHDPAAMLLAFRPDLFTLRRGPVRVATDEGVCRGQTILDEGKKQWTFQNPWTAGERPAVTVALDVDVAKVMAVFRDRYGMKQVGADGVRGGGIFGRIIRRGLLGVFENGGRAFFELMGKDGGARPVGRGGRFRNALTGVALVGAGATAGILSVVMDKKQDRRW